MKSKKALIVKSPESAGEYQKPFYVGRVERGYNLSQTHTESRICTSFQDRNDGK